MANTGKKADWEMPQHLAVLPLRNMVLFPGPPVQLLVGREGSMQLVDQVFEGGERVIAIVAQKTEEKEELGPDDIYDVGVAAFIHRVYRMPNHQLQILVHGLKRIRLQDFTQTAPYLVARVEEIKEIEQNGQEEQALAHNLSQQFQKTIF